MTRTGAAGLEISVGTSPSGQGDRYLVVRSNANLTTGDDPNFEAAVAAAKSNNGIATVTIERSDPISGGSEKMAVYPKRRFRAPDRSDPPRLTGRLPRRAIWQ